MPQESKNDQRPGLFGINRTNRDLTDKSSWGKNQFNNAFPAALLNYMYFRSIKPVYIKLAKDFSVIHEKINVSDLYKIDPSSPNISFVFEEGFIPYQSLVTGTLPRVDLVIERVDGEKRDFLSPLEIKLTALPDDLTSSFDEKDYGSEIVVRPDTIVYLALSFVSKAKPALFSKYLGKVFEHRIQWKKSADAKKMLPDLVRAVDRLMSEHPELEVPLMVQPIWKTKGKSMRLADNCLDVFVWSNFAMTRLFFNQTGETDSITRPERSVIWLTMMLHDYANSGRIGHKKIIDTYTYNTKNDKAFAMGGLRTREYMRSPELLKPRITRKEISQIILGNGQRLLSPERRFDGVIQGSIDIF
ncbi:MAG: HindVP family restriction endonuclease [Patescibacteria group bacterium]|nr:HindVP family restriction endonuclease [Patescibacteria group bacterium]MDE1945606.1 HindVP family restriction endonuclease [Patescibacteria group bacterium]